MFYRSESLKSGRQTLSNSLLFCFILAIALSAAFSEFFQTPQKTDDSLEPWQQLFTPRQLALIQELELTNKLGTFRFNKRQEGGRLEWDMIHPRQLNANDDTITKIFEGIQQINVLKIYPQDSINLSHYSLNNPATVLKLIDGDNQTLVLKTGLVNPIDNSTYMIVSGKTPIFHIEKLNFPMESLNLANFIDSTIFTLPLEEMTGIQIYRGSRLNLSARLKEGQWYNRRNRAFDESKIQAFLKKMFSLRSLMILDETTEKLKKQIKRYTARPLYTIKMHDRQEREHTYKITHPLSKLADIKMEKGENSLITGPEGTHPQLMDKTHLDIFNINEGRLR